MRLVSVVLALPLCAGLLAGCADRSGPDLAGKAAALAKTVAAEGDHVTVPELSDWLIKDQRDFDLVDIRDGSDFASGHIQDARHIPLASLLSEDALAGLPTGRKVVVYSNGTAHAAQAALLLRLVDREAYALLGGFNHWQAYLNDPQAAGVAEMDPRQRAHYQAVACRFAGDYVADAGLAVEIPEAKGQPAAAPAATDALGLGLGLGSEEVQGLGLGGGEAPSTTPADPLGLGLDLGLGGEAAESLKAESPKPAGASKKLLIKAEC